MTVRIDFIANKNQVSTSSISFLQQIQEDWIAHGRDWSTPGFRAVAVHRFGVWLKKIQPQFLQVPFRIIYGMLYRKIRNNYGVELPLIAYLGRRVTIYHQGAIIIHTHCSIGDDTAICQGVTLGNRYSDRPFDAPQLGKRVSVNAGAKILGNVTIGDDASIGANAVVLCDVPAGATAVGIPARIISSS